MVRMLTAEPELRPGPGRARSRPGPRPAIIGLKSGKLPGEASGLDGGRPCPAQPSSVPPCETTNEMAKMVIFLIFLYWIKTFLVFRHQGI